MHFAFSFTKFKTRKASQIGGLEGHRTCFGWLAERRNSFRPLIFRQCTISTKIVSLIVLCQNKCHLGFFSFLFLYPPDKIVFDTLFESVDDVDVEEGHSCCFYVRVFCREVFCIFGPGIAPLLPRWSPHDVSSLASADVSAMKVRCSQLLAHYLPVPFGCIASLQ